MKVSQLKELIARFDDNDEIGAFWDDREWEIHGLLGPGDHDFEVCRPQKYLALIDCR